MTFPESELYPSFEDFMREDKLPPVFPLSQSSNFSESQVYSQHLISEVCDRETYGPFGIGTTDDDLPPNFINSSLAYSPKSIPPHSPSDDCTLFNIARSASSSTLDPSDIATGDADDMLEDLTANDIVNHNFNELSEEDVNVNIGNVPFLENHELMQFLDAATEISDKEDFTTFTYEGNLPSPSISPSPSTTSAPNSVISETPTVSYIKSELSSSDSTNINQVIDNSDNSIVKRSGTRGRKRKLFTNCEEKKKDQNKEAARRYREKKKYEDAKLEAEEAELIEKQKELRKELEGLTRTHKEVLSLAKEFLAEKRRKL